MELKKFVDNLTLRYSTGASEIKIEDVKEYLERTKVTDLQLETIEILMKENYGKTSFPFVKDIKDIYERGYSIVGGNKHKVDSYTSMEKTDDIYYPDRFINHVTMTQNLDLKNVIAKYQRIEVKQMNSHDLSTYDAYFLFAFSDLILNYRERLRKKDVGNEDKTFRELENLKMGVPVDLEPVLPSKDDKNFILNGFNKYRSKR